MKSRISDIVEFEDYNDEELKTITVDDLKGAINDSLDNNSIISEIGFAA